MKRLLRFVLCLVVAAVASTGFAGAASAASPDVSACKNGGYVNYVDPATGQPFASQGRCVRVVVRGGTLVPLPLRFYSYSGVEAPSNSDWCEHVVLTLQGAPPGADELFQVQFWGPTGSTGGANGVTGQLDANGLLSFSFEQQAYVTSGSLQKGTVIAIVDFHVAPDPVTGRSYIYMPPVNC